MANLLGRGASFLASRLKSVQGIRATYVSGSQNITVLLVPGSTEEESFATEDETQDARPVEWILTEPEKLVRRDGTRFKPSRGDYITIQKYNPEVNGRYDVLPIEGRYWKNVDHTGRMIQIHTQYAIGP